MDRSGWRALGGAWWIAIPVALTAAVNFPITRNYFFGDDLLSVYEVLNKPFLELLFVPYGGHLYIVRNAVYAALYAVFGPDPHAYYWVALLTHIANAALLAVLVRALTDSARLACFGAALWGTAPVTEGTIGWYSVYGHALATTALLLVLIDIVWAGRRGRVSTAELAGIPVLVFAASTCFGVGLAFAVLLPVAGWLLLPASPVRRRLVAVLAASALFVVAVYFTSQWLARAEFGSAQHTAGVSIVLRKPFGIADLVVSMVAYGTEQVVLGPWTRFTPGLRWAAVTALPVLVGVIIAVRRAPGATRRAMLAFFLLALGTYGIVAMGRVPFYPAFRELLIRSDRYHYAAPLLLTVVICLALAQIAGPRPAGRWRDGLLAVWLLGLAAALALVRKPVNHFTYARNLADEALASMQDMIERTPPGEDVYIENRLFRGVGPFVLANPRNFPGWAGLFVVYYPNNVVDGHRVFFVEPDETVRAAAQRGVRSRTLLVAPADVAPERVQRPSPAPGQANDGALPAPR